MRQPSNPRSAAPRARGLARSRAKMMATAASGPFTGPSGGGDVHRGASQGSNVLGGWFARPTGPHGVPAHERDNLNTRSQDLIRNDGTARTGKKRRIGMVVGEGWILSPNVDHRALGITAEEGRALGAAMAANFAAWAGDPLKRNDSRRLFNFSQQLRLMAGDRLTANAALGVLLAGIAQVPHPVGRSEKERRGPSRPGHREADLADPALGPRADRRPHQGRIDAMVVGGRKKPTGRSLATARTRCCDQTTRSGKLQPGRDRPGLEHGQARVGISQSIAGR